MLARLIGPVRARDQMFTGRTLTAEEAVDWGMVASRVSHEAAAISGAESRCMSTIWRCVAISVVKRVAAKPVLYEPLDWHQENPADAGG
jgi:enoyl-CoA hydratase